MRKALDNASGDVSYRAMLLLANLYSRTGRDGEVDSLCQYALKTSEPAVKARIYYFLYEENVAKRNTKMLLPIYRIMYYCRILCVLK